MIEESDRLIQIFDALLNIARAEAGSGREGMIDFDAGLVTRDVGELYEPAAEERGFALECRCGAEPHHSRQPRADRSGDRKSRRQRAEIRRRRRLKDAKEATEAGVERSVLLSAHRNGASVEISVGDRGEGIAEADRTRVLGRFVRLENSRTRPGSGLGLSLAAAVARLHNGALRIEDNAPGLRVVISIPAVALSREAAPAAAAPAPEAAA